MPNRAEPLEDFIPDDGPTGTYVYLDIDATGTELERGNEHGRLAVNVCGERRMEARDVIRRLWKVVLKQIQMWGV